MVEIAGESPMELLLSDSSRAHLERARSMRSPGAPSCPVESPSMRCGAAWQPGRVRLQRGAQRVPKAPGSRARGVLGCVRPDRFMGRALGVLHATGRKNVPTACRPPR